MTPRSAAARPTAPRGAARSKASPAAEVRRLDVHRVPKGHHELRAFMTVRNESTRLPHTLQHHRALGVDRFFVVDNGSDDGSVDILLGEPDVHVFSARDSYGDAALGMAWMHALLDEHGSGRWVAIIDADEHLVFPACESMELREYCRLVERAGFDAVSAMVVDMYGERPIARTHPGDAASLLKVCPWFDATGYVITGTRHEMPSVHGGPRARIFWPECRFDGVVAQLEGLMEQAWDEDRYLELHPDVREAVRTGVVGSGHDHFMRFGRFEGRRVGIRPVAAWPEALYLRANPEVGEAIAAGTIESGLDHFLRFGQFEGRFPGFDPSPWLSVAPLVRWTTRKRFGMGRHDLPGARFNTSYDFGAAILHFKMLDDFPSRAAEEATRGEHWKDASEYIRYAERFADNPDMSAFFEGSTRYAGSGQLVELGYMREAYTPVRAAVGSPRWLRSLGRPA